MGGLCLAWLPSGAGCGNQAVLPPSMVRGVGELDLKKIRKLTIIKCQLEIEHAVDWTPPEVLWPGTSGLVGPPRKVWFFLHCVLGAAQ